MLVLVVLLSVGTMNAKDAPPVLAAPSVWVQGHDPLTNARVKKVLPDGILFICDQGLVKARFDQLGPEWATEYGADANRAAAKAAAFKEESAIEIHAREAAARQPERIIGRVVAKRHGDILIINCEESPETGYSPELEGIHQHMARNETTVAKDAPTNYSPVTGIVAVHDAALYLRSRTQDHVTVVVRRSEEDIDVDGLPTPLYTVSK